MMKNLIKKFIAWIVRLYSHFYTYHFYEWLNGKRDLFYTMWIKNFLGEVGEHTGFQYPLRLQGGGNKCVHIGDRTCIHAYCVLGCWEHYGKDEHYNPEIIIGDDCNIGEYCHITAINKITIGNGLLTGRFVYIGDNAHGGLSWEEAIIPPANRKLISKGEIKIGNNVWIGDKVTILGGVTIGDNVIIGANSVITHDVPENCVVCGVPGRIVRCI